MKLKPLNNEVLVKLPEEELVLKNKVWRQVASAHKNGAIATVVARGPKTEMVRVGERVLVPAFSGRPVRTDKGGNYKLIKETEILAFVEEGDDN